MKTEPRKNWEIANRNHHRFRKGELQECFSQRVRDEVERISEKESAERSQREGSDIGWKI